MDEIGEFMSGDHDRIDALLEIFRGGGAGLEEFAFALTRHMDWEEQILFPAFARKVGPESSPAIDTMRLQHEEFKRQIEDIRRCSDADAALRGNLEDVLIESLADHNMAEEDYIYPWIDGALDPVEKAAILKTLLAGRGGQYHDAQNIA
jgi:regulator of cell morphogenesis and NO signaling